MMNKVALQADDYLPASFFVEHVVSIILSRVYLKKEEATARANFSSVQGGKPKV